MIFKSFCGQQHSSNSGCFFKLSSKTIHLLGDQVVWSQNKCLFSENFMTVTDKQLESDKCMSQQSLEQKKVQIKSFGLQYKAGVISSSVAEGLFSSNRAPESASLTHK